MNNILKRKWVISFLLISFVIWILWLFWRVEHIPQIIKLLVTGFAPFVGIWGALYIENLNREKEQQLDIFNKLFSLRPYVLSRTNHPFPNTLIEAINSIESVFQKFPEILSAFYDYQDSLINTTVIIDGRNSNDHFVNLLVKMSVVLDQDQLTPHIIRKPYFPQANVRCKGCSHLFSEHNINKQTQTQSRLPICSVCSNCKKFEVN